jgi:hypothetical protein
MANQTELTETQIDRLFDFCRHHNVLYYDLQVELVDHLANLVAAMMSKEGGGLRFDEALEKTYASFGKNGFALIVTNRQQTLFHAARREKSKMFLNYFTWPKAGLTALLVTVFIMAPYVLPVFWLKALLIVSVVAFVIWETVENIRLKKRRSLQMQKLLLTQQAYGGTSVAAPLLIQLAAFRFVNWFGGPSSFVISKFYIFSGTFILLFLIGLVILNFKAKLYAFARHQYPAAFRAS